MSFPKPSSFDNSQSTLNHEGCSQTPPEPEPTHPWLRENLAAWNELIHDLSSTNRLEITSFVAAHMDALFLHIPSWFSPLLRCANGVFALKLLFPASIKKLFAHYAFCCDVVVVLRQTIFLSEENRPQFRSLLQLLDSGCQVPAIYNAIALMIHPQNQHQSFFHQQLQLEPNLSDVSQPLDYETSFAPQFFWFRHLLAQYVDSGDSLRADLSVALSQPSFTIDSLTKNAPMNSYAEKEYYAALSTQSLPTLKPSFIQFDDYSTTLHPVLKSQPNAMSDASIINTEQYRLYFAWMFIIGEPNCFISLIKQLTSTLSQIPHLAKISLRLRLLYATYSKPWSVHNQGLLCQLQILNYRLYMLSIPDTRSPPPISTSSSTPPTTITPIHSMESDLDADLDISFSPIDLFDPILYSLPTNPIHIQSHVFNNWKSVVLQHAVFEDQALLDTQFPTWLCSLPTDAFFNMWYLRWLYVPKLCSKTFSIASPGHYFMKCNHFFRTLIERSYDQLMQNKTTAYQHVYSRSFDLQLPDGEFNLDECEITPCARYLTFMLLGPFYTFDNDDNDHLTLLQKHITLSLHSGFLNISVPREQSNNPSGLQRLLVPISAVVYTWLLMKSGTTKYFDTPVEQGASNMFYHALDSRYFDYTQEYDTTTARIDHVSTYKFTKFLTSNNIALLPNPLLDKSNPVIAQIKAMIVDTDGEIWFVRLRNEDRVAFNMDRPINNQDNRYNYDLFDWDDDGGGGDGDEHDFLKLYSSELRLGKSILTFQLNDPFSHTTLSDLFTSARSQDIDDYDFPFYSKWAADYIVRLMEHKNNLFDPLGWFHRNWTDEHTTRFRAWLLDAENRAELLDFFQPNNMSSFPHTLEEIHPDIEYLLENVHVGGPVDYNKCFPHRFANPNNLVESNHIESGSNQLLLKTPQLRALKQKYREYLNQLYQAESELVINAMKTVILNANAAGLLDDTNDNTAHNASYFKCYPFPQPTPLPSALPSDYAISAANPTQPDAIQYHRDISKWCVEMLLVTALYVQPSFYLKDLDHEFVQLRPERIIPDQHPQALSLTPDVISKSIAVLTNSSHHRRFLSSTHIEPINPLWLLRLNKGTDPWFMFDSFINRIISTSLKSYETLLSMSR